MLQTVPRSPSLSDSQRCGRRATHFDPAELDVERTRAESLISLGGRLTDLHWHLVSGSVALADGPIWIADGSPTAAHWIADRLDVCAATAREWIRVGRALSGLGATADAFEAGDLTFAKVRAITRIARSPQPHPPITSPRLWLLGRYVTNHPMLSRPANKPVVGSVGETNQTAWSQPPCGSHR